MTPAPDPETALAFLNVDDHVRQVCVGCTEVLHRLGMVRVINERVLPVTNAPPGKFCSRIFQIVDPFTIDTCRSAIASRHLDSKPWGAR